MDEALLDDARRGISTLVSQLRLPPDQFRDDAVIPLVWTLKQALHKLKEVAVHNQALSAYIQAAYDVIPLVVLVLRKRCQQAPAKEDEVKLKHAVKMYQTELQRLTNPNASPQQPRRVTPTLTPDKSYLSSSLADDASGSRPESSVKAPKMAVPIDAAFALAAPYDKNVSSSGSVKNEDGKDKLKSSAPASTSAARARNDASKFMITSTPPRVESTRSSPASTPVLPHKAPVASTSTRTSSAEEESYYGDSLEATDPLRATKAAEATLKGGDKYSEKYEVRGVERAELLDDDEDDVWADWSYEEGQVLYDSDDDDEASFIASMDQFEEFFSSSNGPRTLSDLQRHLEKAEAQRSDKKEAWAPASKQKLTKSPGHSRVGSMRADKDLDSVNEELLRLAVKGEKESGYIGLESDPDELTSSSGKPSPTQTPTSSTPVSPFLSRAMPSSSPKVATTHASKEGWLLKLSPNTTLGKRFQKRYFILENFTLTYYASMPLPNSATKALGYIQIRENTTIYRLTGPESKKKTAYLQSGNGFELRADFGGILRTFLLVAPSALEKKEWCDAISMVKVVSQQVNHTFDRARDGKRGSQQKISKLKSSARKVSRRFGNI